MLKKDVIAYFNGVTRVANFLEISHAAVSSWSNIIPKGRALELDKLTNGELMYNPEYYKKR